MNWFWQTRQATTQTLTWMPAPCANLTKQNWSHSLPFQQFQALLTLFSKSFASFLHSTCSLSVSNIHWALDEVYHPLCAPLPRNVTLIVQTERAGLQMTDRTLTSCGNLFQRVGICAHAGIASCDHKSRLESLDFHAESLPIHALVPREYHLISFPPHTYMLKLSRFPSLTSCMPQDLQIRSGAHWSHVSPLLKQMLNVAHVQHHQDTCVNATQATLKHENTKTWHLSDTRRTETKDTEANMLSGITRKSNLRSTFLLVHWLLQFTMLITLRCTLHGCSSRGIHHWKLCWLYNCGHVHRCVVSVVKLWWTWNIACDSDDWPCNIGLRHGETAVQPRIGSEVQLILIIQWAFPTPLVGPSSTWVCFFSSKQWGKCVRQVVPSRQHPGNNRRARVQDQSLQEGLLEGLWCWKSEETPRWKRKHIQRFLQRKPAPGVVVLPFNACRALFIAFRESRGKSRVGNKFWRRGRQLEHSGHVRFSILYMKRRSNFKTTPMGFDCAMTFRTTARCGNGARTIDRRGHPGRGSARGTRPEQNWAKLTREIWNLPGAAPRCAHTDAKLNFQCGVHGGGPVSSRTACAPSECWPFLGAPPRTVNSPRWPLGGHNMQTKLAEDLLMPPQSSNWKWTYVYHQRTLQNKPHRRRTRGKRNSRHLNSIVWTHVVCRHHHARTRNNTLRQKRNTKGTKEAQYCLREGTLRQHKRADPWHLHVWRIPTVWQVKWQWIGAWVITWKECIEQCKSTVCVWQGLPWRMNKEKQNRESNKMLRQFSFS